MADSTSFLYQSYFIGLIFGDLINGIIQISHFMWNKSEFYFNDGSGAAVVSSGDANLHLQQRKSKKFTK